MSFEQWNMLVQTIAISATFGLQAGAFVFAYAQFRRFKRERIERVMKQLIPIMTRGVPGEIIPGLTEEASKQHKAWVEKVLEEEL